MKRKKIYILSDTNIEGANKIVIIKQKFFKKEIDFSRYDYIIFTSKNGVIAVDKISKDWKRLPAIVIGEATAKMVEKLGGKVIYRAKKFYGDIFAKEIVENFQKNRKFLYIRGEVVLSNLFDILKNSGFLIEEVVLYKTICSECKGLKKPEKNSYIIFSSPSTINCFFKCFKWDKSFKAIAIGKKTASFLPSDIDFKISPFQTLKKCVEWVIRG